MTVMEMEMTTEDRTTTGEEPPEFCTVCNRVLPVEDRDGGFCGTQSAYFSVGGELARLLEGVGWEGFSCGKDLVFPRATLLVFEFWRGREHPSTPQHLINCRKLARAVLHGRPDIIAAAIIGARHIVRELLDATPGEPEDYLP